MKNSNIFIVVFLIGFSYIGGYSQDFCPTCSDPSNLSWSTAPMHRIDLANSVVAVQLDNCTQDWTNQPHGSAVLINNSKDPGIPYLLSARHNFDLKDSSCNDICNPSNNPIISAGNIIEGFSFWFGYNDDEVNVTKITSSAEILYESEQYDIILLKLSELPPDRYAYAGYKYTSTSYGQTYDYCVDSSNPILVSSELNDDYSNVYSFHHPGGSLKKYIESNSITNQASCIISTAGCQSQISNPIVVNSFVAGIVEVGSSGAPLFYNNKVIGIQSKGLGQLAVYGSFAFAFEDGLSMILGTDTNTIGLSSTPPIIIDESSLPNTAQIGTNIQIEFYVTDISAVDVYLSSSNCNSDQLLEQNLSVTPYSLNIESLFINGYLNDGTYNLKIVRSGNPSQSDCTVKTIEVIGNNTPTGDVCEVNTTSNQNAQLVGRILKSVSNQDLNISLLQECDQNNYDVVVDINSNQNYNLSLDVYSDGNYLGNQTYSQNSNFPLTVISNVSFEEDIVLDISGNSDNQCSINETATIYGSSCPVSNTTCEIPTNLGTIQSGNQVTMSWTQVSLSTSYDIQYSSDGINHNNGGSNGYTLTSISANFSSCNTHYFRVRSNCTNGSSSLSPWHSFYISNGSNGGCSTPSLAITENGNYVQTNWNNVSGETGYELQHRVDGGSWSGVTMTANSNSNLYPSDDCLLYEARIRSICNCVTSGWSTIASVTTSGCFSNPTCIDGVQNGNETGVDCGGSCPNCPSASCNSLQITWPDPNGCNQQIALVTSVKYIRWSPLNCGSGLVNIQYSINGGSSWIPQAVNESDDGIYTFNVTQNHVSNQFRVRVQCTDGSYCGETCNYKIFGDSVFGCSDQAGHNYNPAVTHDNGTCETCNDGVLNGDEGGIDCGGSNPACTPCNPGNSIQFDNNTCNGIYAWDEDIIITWDPGSNACGNVFFYASDDGGQNWQIFFNQATGITNDGEVDFQGISSYMQGDLLFKLVCVNNPSNYTITSCTTTVTTCGGTPPNNNTPCGATNLSVGNNNNCNYHNFSNCNSSLSYIGDQGCGGTLTYDNWFKFTVPSSGKVSIETFSNTVSWNQYGLYSGPCSNLVLYSCADSNNSTSSQGFFENLPVGSTMYIQFYTIDNLPDNAELCVYEPQVCSGESILFPTDVTIDCATISNNLTFTGDVLGESTLCPSCNEASYTDTDNYTYCGGGTINRIWTYVDECGISNTYNQVISIEPDFSLIDYDVPIDIVIGCDENHHDLTLTGAPTNWVGACGPSTISYNDNLDNLNYCSNTGHIIRFWKLQDDECGIGVTKIQNIYLTDNGCLSTRCEGETCSTAQEISYNGTYFCDGASFGDSANAGDATHADWYVFTPEEDGFISINSCYNNVDSRLFVHEGSCNNVIDNNDDACPISVGGQGWASRIDNIPVVCGQTYYFEWDSRWAEEEFFFDFEFLDNAEIITEYPDAEESFENSDLGNWIQSCNDDFDWTIHSGTTPSNNTGPSNAKDGNLYIYTEASGNSNKKAIILSPTFDLAGLANPAFLYYYHMEGDDIGTLKIEISIEGSDQWFLIGQHNHTQTNGWYSSSNQLGINYLDKKIRFRITGTMSDGYQSDIALDRLHVYDFCAPWRSHMGSYNNNSLLYLEADTLVYSDAKIFNGNVVYDSGREIILYPGFECNLGAEVELKIDGCDVFPNSIRADQLKE